MRSLAARTALGLVVLALSLLPLALSQECVPYAVLNPSFEEAGGWDGYKDGFTFTTETASQGLRSAAVTHGGAAQVFTVPHGTRAFQASLDSRNEGVSGAESDRYSIYCDVLLASGHWSYGHIARFTVGNDQWHRQTLIVSLNTEMSELWCYCMFKSYLSGTAYFDDFKLWTSTGGITNCDSRGGFPQECSVYNVENPSFEETGGWQAFMQGFQYTSDTASQGQRSIVITDGGALQVWQVPAGTRAVQVKADSRNVGVTKPDSDLYSIYCDVVLADGSWSYEHIARFTVGNTAWHERTLTVQLDQELSELWCYAMFWKYSEGQAYFDNFRVWTSASTITDCDDSCGPCSQDLTQTPPGYKSLQYQASGAHIVNPGRGFVEQSSGRASAFVALELSDLEWQREQNGIGVLWRQYILDSFVDSDISPTYLDLIRSDLGVVRQAGFTVILRFLYTNTEREEAPYGDASKARMLAHISQLSTVLTEHEAVIDGMHAGFIGIWGEWYYTTDFGDPNHLDWDDPINVNGLTPQNWQDRGEVLLHLLDSTPQSIDIQVRTPLYKRQILQDYTPATETDMRQKTNKARIGHHNDCFLASATDEGTYVNKSEEYPYLKADTLWSSMGGETCGLDPTGRHECPTAVRELEELHWTYLDQGYHPDVLQGWKDQGCYREIHRRLGYRLLLSKATLPESVQQGETLCYHLELENHGYARPQRDRDISLGLRAQSGELYAAKLTSEPGDFQALVPGTTHTLQGQVYVPADLPTGSYQMFLVITDQRLSLRSDYNILLANVDVPEYNTGLNLLRHTLQVDPGEGGTEGQQCPHLTAMPAQQHTGYSRLYCGLGACD